MMSGSIEDVGFAWLDGGRVVAELPYGGQVFDMVVVLPGSGETVDEEGIEAAAATSVAISLTSMPPGITVDRPYLLAIRERLSGTILFIGAIRDPR